MKHIQILLFFILLICGYGAAGNAQNTVADDLQKTQLVNCIDRDGGYHIGLNSFMSTSINAVQAYSHTGTQLKMLNEDHHMIMKSFENQNAFGKIAKNIAVAIARNEDCSIIEVNVSKAVNFTPPESFYDGFFEVADLFD